MPEPMPENHFAETVAAIDFGGTKVDVALASRTGQILRQQRILIDHSHDAEHTVMSALDAVGEFISWGSSEHAATCTAVAIASPGVVHEDRIDLAPNVQGWGELRLPDLIRDHLGLDRFVIGNDVNYATLAELREGALMDTDPGVYLGLGTGIGAGIAIDGKVLEGAHGIAGEVGYFWSPSGASVEAATGGRSIEERAYFATGRRIAASDVLRSQEPSLREIASEAFDAMASAVENLALTIDPSVVVLGGGLMEAGTVVIDEVQARIVSLPCAIELRTGHFVHDAVVRGLAMAAAELASERRAAWTS
jgi:glucokinase